MDNLTPSHTSHSEQPADPLEQPLPVTPPEQPPAAAPKLAIWKIALVAVLAIALIAGAVTYLLARNSVTPLPDSPTSEADSSATAATTTWTTYTNTKHQFSVEYPSDWMQTESPSGNGALFAAQSSSDTLGESNEITVSVGQKTLTEEELTFEEYAKVAAAQEIQNYNRLASIEPIILGNNMKGYKTTWMVSSLATTGSPESESAPITYFQVPGSDTLLLRLSSGYDVDPAIYDRMIQSVTFLSPATAATPTASSEPAPTTGTQAVSEELTLKTAIKQQILADSESDGSSMTISVSQLSGNFAKGMVSGDGGGGLWFASKVNGAWQLVWDGNGVIFCSDLSEYPDFPTSMIPECYDQAADTMVQR